MIRILRAADHKRMPWKNGGGETVEITLYPEGAGLDDFLWRVSMATVASDGPFSTFPGIDRSLTVVSGKGMSLDIEGLSPVTLHAGSAPLDFPGDAPTFARLVDGPIVDFNVMSRRGVMRHEVEWVGPGPIVPPTPKSVQLLLCVAGNVAIVADGSSDRLQANDACLIHPGHPPVAVSPDSVAILVTLLA